jgi:2-polyprenyl-3-methyl-5-hydroxy-6-metoxy-1,4-benzoquinol methylase
MDNEFYEGYWDKLENQHDRHPANRIRYREIRKILRSISIPKAQILDVGCGSGVLLQNLVRDFPDIQVSGSDISKSAINLAKQKVPKGLFYVNDFAIPKNSEAIRTEKYDVVLASEVIEHVEYDDQFLENMARILKPLGYIILTTQSGPRYRMDKEVLGHLRHYTIKELISKCEVVGLEVIKAYQFGFPFQSLQKIIVDLNFERVKKTFHDERNLSSFQKILMDLIYLSMFIRIGNAGPQLVLVIQKNED